MIDLVSKLRSLLGAALLQFADASFQRRSSFLGRILARCHGTERLGDLVQMRLGARQLGVPCCELGF